MSTSFNEHTGIVEALQQGDADLAAARVRQHIWVQGERFADLLATLASLRSEAAKPIDPEATLARATP